MDNKVVVDAVECFCKGKTGALNCCCRKSLGCLRINIIARLIFNLFVIGFNIYVLWLLMKLDREQRRIEPIVSYENDINPEGFYLYFAGGICSVPS